MARSRRDVNFASLFTLNCQFVFIIITILLTLESAHAWDSTDLELFDLVEEVQQNFYDVLQIDRSASQADVRRAYRRLTLQHHPDKNKEEGAEEQFRKLVAVSEVLRDEEKRKKYDDILENGLPDWRQPVFYYRRVRKMGLLELGLLLSGILTVGHYLVLWSMYFERRLEMEALIKPKREKKSKKSSKQSSTQPTNEQVTPSPMEDPTFVQKPSLADILPWKLGCFTVATIGSVPGVYRGLVENWKARRKAKEEEEEKEEEDEEAEDKGRDKDRGGPRERQRLDPAMYDYDRSASASVTMNTAQEMETSNGNIASNQTGKTDKLQQQKFEWSASEVSGLAKCMTKYPGGTTDRWLRIAEELNRPLDAVIKKAKQLKTQRFASNVDVAAQGITGGVQHAVTSKKSGSAITDDITFSTNQNDWREESQCHEYSTGSPDSRRHRLVKPVKSTDRTLTTAHQAGDNAQMGEDHGLANQTTNNIDIDELVHPGVESCAWTQRQQKILEKAMQVFPRGSENRWDKIADTVPGKTKEECIVRYKELVEVIKRKKKPVVQR